MQSAILYTKKKGPLHPRRPGADKGGEGKSKRRKNIYGTKKSKERREESTDFKLHARSKKNLEQANLRASSPGLSGGGATKEELLAG